MNNEREYENGNIYEEEIDVFLYKILESSKSDGAVLSVNDKKVDFLLRSEEAIIKFLNSTSRVELEFPPLNSYYRRIIHRLGRKYNLAHRIEMTTIFNCESTLRKIYLTKLTVLRDNNEKSMSDGSNCTVTKMSSAPMPALLKCSDWFNDTVTTTTASVTNSSENILVMKKNKEKNFSSSSSLNKKHKDKNSSIGGNDSKSKNDSSTTSNGQFKILKRRPDQAINGNAPTNDINKDNNTSQNTILITDEQLPSTLSRLTFEEREAKYQEARERIFKDFKGDNDDRICDSVSVCTVEAAAITKLENVVINPVVLSPSAILNNENDIDIDSEVVVSNDSTNNADSINIMNMNSMKTLNPNANPFTFIPSAANSTVIDDDSTIEISHIFTIKLKQPQSNLLLDLTDLQEVLSSCTQKDENFKGFIKVHSVPTTFAFLLSTTTPSPTINDINNNPHNTKWIIEKWQPKFYSE